MTTLRTAVTAAALSFLVLGSGNAQTAPDAQPATAPSAQSAELPTHTDYFTVALPSGYAEFTKQVQTTKSPDGEIVTTNWVSKAPTSEALVATMSKMPAKILDSRKLIDSTRDSLLKALGATMESEEQKPGDVPSTVMLFHSANAWFQARFSVINDRFYQLLYVGRSADQRSAPAVAHMFETFRISDIPAVAQVPPPHQ